jgi:hypothetical protein
MAKSITSGSLPANRQVKKNYIPFSPVWCPQISHYIPFLIGYPDAWPRINPRFVGGYIIQNKIDFALKGFI